MESRRYELGVWNRFSQRAYQKYLGALESSGAQTIAPGFNSGNVFGLSLYGAPTDVNFILHLVTAVFGGPSFTQFSPRPLNSESGGIETTNVPALAWIPLTVPSN